MSTAERNRRNRGFGKGVERAVANILGGQRVPLSGAVKGREWTLLGDVHVKNGRGENVAVVECKGTSGITPKGEKTFVLKKSVLDQAQQEAESMDAVGAVWVHWRGANYRQDDYVILPSGVFIELVEMLKERGDGGEKGGVGR